MNVYSANEVLEKGLTFFGISRKQQEKVTLNTNLEDFCVHFGSPPEVCASIWEALQTTAIDEARIYKNSTQDFQLFMLEGISSWKRIQTL